MSFVMPESIKNDKVPQQIDKSVNVKYIEQGRFAVYRFSGLRNKDNESKSLKRLKDWLGATSYD